MNEVEYLIVSSSIDYASDYVCYELKRRGDAYFRINRDRFSEYQITYDIMKKVLYIQTAKQQYCVSDKTLKSVYFRAPVFIRSNKTYSVEEQLYRSQWSSFIRNLSVFKQARWVNYPMNTYQAENKVYQLDVAAQCDLLIPETIVSNCIPCKTMSASIYEDQLYAVKSLDTSLFYDNERKEEYFTYTQILSGKELKSSSLNEAPVFIQEYIENKIDIRVTAIGDKLFATKILLDGDGIYGDWRKNSKEHLNYIPIKLPSNVEDKLVKLMHILSLKFGGIDLAYSNGKYYFIEVNPTGEWAWLIQPTQYPLTETIVDLMEKECV